MNYNKQVNQVYGALNVTNSAKESHNMSLQSMNAQSSLFGAAPNQAANVNCSVPISSGGRGGFGGGGRGGFGGSAMQA